MKASVAARFVAFSERFEGKLGFMYLDVKGLVTVGIGNLVDRSTPDHDVMDSSIAQAMPFKRPDGSPAAAQDIATAWHDVKARKDLKMAGGGKFANVTTLRLTEDGIQQIVLAKVAEMEGHLVHRFPDFADWCADAQLATISLSWACGPDFRFPRLAQALRDRDWLLASVECRMDETGNPGLRPRNAANYQLYRNAHFVAASGLTEPALDPERLYWPSVLPDDAPATLDPDFMAIYQNPKDDA